MSKNFIPTYSITNLILNYIVKCEISLANIAKAPLPPKYKTSLYKKFRADDITHLSQLIGYPIGYDQARRIQEGQASSKEYKIFSNYRGVHEFIKSYNRREFIPISAQLVQHLNMILLKGILDEWDTGKFRTFSERPQEIYDTWYKHREYNPSIVPVNHVNALMTWFDTPKVTIHKLVQIPVILYEFVDKALLTTGNQITVLLLISLLMKEFGYNPDGLLPIAKCVNTLGMDFDEAIRITRQKRDLTVFIEAILYTFSLEILNIENQIEMVFTSKVKRHADLSLKLNDRQIKVLEYLEINKKITRRDYTKLMGTSFMTSFRDLQELIEKGFIEQRGVGRGTYYVLIDQQENQSEMRVFSDI